MEPTEEIYRAYRVYGELEERLDEFLRSFLFIPHLEIASWRAEIRPAMCK